MSQPENPKQRGGLHNPPQAKPGSPGTCWPRDA
ncbi:Uncharacterised protein [Bordetella pertussis]|nr:Uncharacterised protein [Bordetella pertussis]